MRKLAFTLAIVILSITLCACHNNGIDVPEDISPFVNEDIEKYEPILSEYYFPEDAVFDADVPWMDKALKLAFGTGLNYFNEKSLLNGGNKNIYRLTEWSFSDRCDVSIRIEYGKSKKHGTLYVTSIAPIKQQVQRENGFTGYDYIGEKIVTNKKSLTAEQIQEFEGYLESSGFNGMSSPAITHGDDGSYVLLEGYNGDEYSYAVRWWGYQFQVSSVITCLQSWGKDLISEDIIK